MNLTMNINAWTVPLAAVFSVVLGLIWYSPMLFGKFWMVYSGLSFKTIEDAWFNYIVGFFTTLISIVVLALVLTLTKQLGSLTGSVLLTFLLWLGFSAAPRFSQLTWERKNLKLYAINISFDLLSLLSSTLIFVYLG